MKQQYFILVVAHSLHGRLRRIHIPHQVIYAILALAVFGGISLFGLLSSYARMTWKIANYNSLRTEVDALRERYQQLQRVNDETTEQLATLQLFATEVSVAYGIKRKLEGPLDIADEGRLIPTFTETLKEYDFLKSANISMIHRQYPRRWLTNVRPSIWPVNGRLLSYFGRRNDPFSGLGAFHSGVDISASTGTPVKAAADGIITHAEWAGAYGKLVVIDHGNRMQTYYAHLSRFAVVPGQEIRKGQLIAFSGGTGRVTSPHLHWEVRQGGAPINPTPFLKSTLAQSESPHKDMPF